MNLPRTRVHKGMKKDRGQAASEKAKQRKADGWGERGQGSRPLLGLPFLSETQLYTPGVRCELAGFLELGSQAFSAPWNLKCGFDDNG